MVTKWVEDRCLTFCVFLLFGTSLLSNRSKAAHKSTILKHSEGCKLFNARTVRLDFRDTDSTSETADAPQTAGFACPSATRHPFRPLQHRPHCCHSTHRQGNHRLWVHPRRPPHTTNEPWSLHDQGSHKTIVAVAAGFEPAVAINHTAFRVLHLRPLGHATADYRSGITPHSATRQPVGRDTSPGCASITEPTPGSTRPKHAPSRRAAHSPHAADVVPVFRVSPRRRRPTCAEPSR